MKSSFWPSILVLQRQNHTSCMKTHMSESVLSSAAESAIIYLSLSVTSNSAIFWCFDVCHPVVPLWAFYTPAAAPLPFRGAARLAEPRSEIDEIEGVLWFIESEVVGSIPVYAIFLHTIIAVVWRPRFSEKNVHHLYGWKGHSEWRKNNRSTTFRSSTLHKKQFATACWFSTSAIPLTCFLHTFFASFPEW